MKNLCLLFIALSSACVQVYTPPTGATNQSWLVVEGFINNGPDSTFIMLTRTFNIGVNYNGQVTPELGAQLQVQGTDNSSYPLVELGGGKYAAPGLALNNAIQYRLHIKTTAGKDYLSNYVVLKVSPPIDSIGWNLTGNGLQIYVDTHDPQSASHYYQWEYGETWEFNSVFFSELQYVNKRIQVRNPDTIDTCWTSDSSTNILLGSSAALSQDQIYQAPLVLIPLNSWEIGVEYSINVRQYVLTSDAYNFWLNLQKNTEQIGSFFSPEPSTISGNIHNSQDTSELVVGYISAGTMQEKRVFITYGQIPNWNFSFYPNSCMETDIPPKPDSLAFWLGAGAYLPVDSVAPPGKVGYDVAPRYCVDCTTLGTNHKPSFWP